jgi:hypothetical protein
MVADGAQDLSESLAKNQAAHTQHATSPSCQEESAKHYSHAPRSGGEGGKNIETREREVEPTEEEVDRLVAKREKECGDGGSTRPPPPRPVAPPVPDGDKKIPPVVDPPPCVPPRGSGTPSGNIEERLELLLLGLIGGIDNELEAVAKQLDAAQNDGKASNELNLKFQKLIEKRKQMFELMSNLSMKFSEMSKTAIANLARA